MEGITLLSRCCGEAIYSDTDGAFFCSKCKSTVPPEVFISYHGGGGNEKRSSYPEALLLKKYLAKMGIPAFVCRDEHRSNFKRAISEALRDANHFVLVAKDAELLSSSGWIIDDEIEKFDAYIKNSRNKSELVKKPREAVMTAYLYGGMTREELTLYTDAFVTRDVITEGQGGFDSIYLMISRAILATRRRLSHSEGNSVNTLSFDTRDKNEATDKKGQLKKATERSAALSQFSFTRLKRGGYSVSLSGEYRFKGDKNRIEIPSEYCSEPVLEISAGAFKGCASLASVIIPSTVEKIGAYAFFGCTGLTDIYLPESIIELGEAAFSECFSLESLSLPEGISFISDRLFENCVNLRELYLSNRIVYVGKRAFYGCSNLSHTVDKGGRYLGNNLNPYLVLTKFTGKKAYSVNANCRIIGESAFLGLPLTKINIPCSVVAISDYAFAGCKKLKEITLSLSNLKYIGESAFSGCERLVPPSLQDSSLIAGDRAFEGCKSDMSICEKKETVKI